MNDEAVDDALTPRAAVGEYRVPAEDRILRPGTGKNKLLAVNGNHRVLEEGDGLSRHLFSVTGELLQALEYRHEGNVLFARLDQPLDDGRLLRQNLVDEILYIETLVRPGERAPIKRLLGRRDLRIEGSVNVTVDRVLGQQNVTLHLARLRPRGKHPRPCLCLDARRPQQIRRDDGVRRRQIDGLPHRPWTTDKHRVVRI